MVIRSVRDLAQLVLRRRKELGLTQAELALRAGVRRATVVEVERGTSRPSFATALGLLAALDMSLSATTRNTAAASSPVTGPRRTRIDLDELLARVRD